jgi:putative sterol carrier protein
MGNDKETAMAKFLSDEWFAKVKELHEEAGDVKVPGPLKDLTINLNVTLADGSTKAVHLTGGQFAQGTAAGAPVTVALPADVAKKIFIDADQQAGMQAFMSGQMRVEGDVTKLMVLQTVQPSPELKDLLEDIKDITE